LLEARTVGGEQPVTIETAVRTKYFAGGSSKPVSDPALTAKILAARAILKRDIVNDDDLIDLERKGAFANLDVAPAGDAGAPLPHMARLAGLVQRRRNGDERAGRAIGAIVIVLRGSARHGEAWFEQVTGRVGMCRSALYARERLARCWTSSEYDRLLRRRGPSGARLYEAHLLAIAQVTAEVQRAELVERVLRENLNVRQLQAILRFRARARSFPLCGNSQLVHSDDTVSGRD
jgi:hypothetical protein